MYFSIEFDLFVGLGIRWIGAEYWKMLCIHLPFITFMISFANNETEENSEFEKTQEERF